MIEKSLYDGSLIYLGAFNQNEDPLLESVWTYDPTYAYYLGTPPRAWSPEDLKKRHEKLIKGMEDHEKSYYFAVKLNISGALIGTLLIHRILWNHGVGQIIFTRGDRQLSYDFYQEALHLALVYAFLELNLFRITMKVPEFDTHLINMIETCGFVREVAQRRAEYLNNRYWDLYHYGILKEDWEKEGYESRV
jgi:RimJ/RimL family protein N-acetyltransferase